MRLLVVLVCALAVGCASEDSPATSGGGVSAASTPPTSQRSSESASPSTGPSGAGTRIIAADSEFGTMLYDASGQPIYLFTAEPGSRPGCYDACAEDWPPVLTDGAPRATGAVRAGLLGTTRARRREQRR